MKSMFVGVGLVLGATSLGLMSCSGDSAAPPTSAANIGPTNFVTIPPVPVTIAPATIPVDVPGSIIEFESSYTLTADDYPSTVATKFNVVFTEFMELNGFELVGQCHDRVARRRLVACADQRVERERVIVGCGPLLFEQATQHPTFDNRQHRTCQQSDGAGMTIFTPTAKDL